MGFVQKTTLYMGDTHLLNKKGSNHEHPNR
uniref:Uncharacterized protein n=1 Tax=Siphoviridae sp. ctj7g1 TaxID=2826438 RepID=A0A8S5R2E0_9CAUD|nr:MAG TPA: hypothetical protein [Siphoviridae sp. ctj7g1]DAJ16176.1 MAG TPA: hypothetical protein [Siphoviridae sp. cttiG1]DAP92095.1 MAG TPA: hypothetical protein [Caudoviricetes sp.]DAT02913.1 MAG TPA: hypothetical protein [Caudoviricetes sp.]